MNRRELLKGLVGGAATLALGNRLWAQTPGGPPQGRPNILWLVIEDTSAYEFGCYGNAAVKTPTIDGLAARGMCFTRAWAAGPQCSPSRASIITGSFATTYGMDWHRKPVQVPNDIFYPPLLRQAGYFCTNNAKTDYNARGAAPMLWDENGGQATYNSPRRGANQPFFAVFNCGATHMSRIRSFDIEERRDFSQEGLDSRALPLPPHVPDLPAIRSDFAYHLEGVQDIDGWVNVFLEDLKAKGLDEDTIVFFCSDHGGCLPRGKGFVYNTGLQVPLVVYVPPKFRSLAGFTPGTASDQLVHLMDLSPTFLSLAGVQPPTWMQGRAILGRHRATPRQYQYAFAANQAAHYVPARAISDGRFHLIRSYTPHKPYCLRNGFQWGMPSNLAWDEHALSGHALPQHLQPYRPHPGEMLFDLQSDPFELKDLATDPQHRNTLNRLQAALDDHLRETRDLGLFPPSARQESNLYEWTRETKYPLDELLVAAKTAATATQSSAATLNEYLQSDKPELRFWGASGWATLAVQNPGAAPSAELLKAIGDTDDFIAAEAAHALCYLGRGDLGAPALVKSFSGGSKGAYSALETLALTPVGKESLRPYLSELQQLAGVKITVSATQEGGDKTESEGNEEGGGDWQARAILVNLGELPVQKLYTPAQRRQGREVNTGRKPIWPRPNLRANALPADTDGVTAPAARRGKRRKARAQ